MAMTAPHPSAYIREEMAARGWSVRDLASAADGEFPILPMVLDAYLDHKPGKTALRMSHALAEDLAKAFDVAPELFLNLERAWLESRGEGLP